MKIINKKVVYRYKLSFFFTLMNINKRAAGHTVRGVLCNAIVLHTSPCKVPHKADRFITKNIGGKLLTTGSLLPMIYSDLQCSVSTLLKNSNRRTTKVNYKKVNYKKSESL